MGDEIKFHVTKHAQMRYVQRIARGAPTEMADILEHLASARRATGKQLARIRATCRSYGEHISADDSEYAYFVHGPTASVFITRRAGPQKYNLITCWCDIDRSPRGKERRRKHGPCYS